MKKCFLLAAAVTLSLTGAATPTCKETALTNVTGLLTLNDADFAGHPRFDLTGTVLHFGECFPVSGEKERHYSVSLYIDGYVFHAHGPLPPAVSEGDTIRIIGVTCYDRHRFRVYRIHESLKIANRPRQTPVPIFIGDSPVDEDRCNMRLITVEGIVEEVFSDEVDPEYTFLVINVKGTLLHAATAHSDHKGFNRLIGTVARITGIYMKHPATSHRFMGPLLRIHKPDNIAVIKPASDDLMRLSDCPSPPYTSPSEIAGWGRRKMTGNVLAVWNGNRLLLKTDDGNIHHAELIRGYPAPATGRRIVIGGIPETDFYHINLVRARWRSVPGSAFKPDTAAPETPKSFLLNEHGGIAVRNFGRTVCVRGTVTPPPAAERGEFRLHLNCDGNVIPVDIESVGRPLSDFPDGCIVEVTGVLFMDIDNWQEGEAFPKCRETSIITRSPSDLKVISMPSWWTPARLVTVIATLIAVLAGILVWNRILGLLVGRRSRELLREQISHAGTAMKVDERTRLAVELHDSLSQNLAGVACQIESMRCALSSDPGSVEARLTTAKRMLMSCRTELKRCLFDLRCNALEEKNLNNAIRTTLEPVTGGCELVIRFNVSRSRLLDTTAHSIICIVRELASNAVRHGRATRILIAGDISDNKLLFSVKDNGTGFSPHTAAGPSDGHFGIQGIRDRTDRLGGTFSIESGTGGTYAKVILDLTENKTT